MKKTTKKENLEARGENSQGFIYFENRNEYCKEVANVKILVLDDPIFYWCVKIMQIKSLNQQPLTIKIADNFSSAKKAMNWADNLRLDFWIKPGIIKAG